jgi:hypothetical protein
LGKALYQISKRRTPPLNVIVDCGKVEHGLRKVIAHAHD